MEKYFVQCDLRNSEYCVGSSICQAPLAEPKGYVEF